MHIDLKRTVLLYGEVFSLSQRRAYQTRASKLWEAAFRFTASLLTFQELVQQVHKAVRGPAAHAAHEMVGLVGAVGLTSFARPPTGHFEFLPSLQTSSVMSLSRPAKSRQRAWPAEPRSPVPLVQPHRILRSNPKSNKVMTWGGQSASDRSISSACDRRGLVHERCETKRPFADGLLRYACAKGRM